MIGASLLPETPKDIILRGIGPSLAASGVNGAMTDPASAFTIRPEQLCLEQQLAIGPSEMIEDTGLASMDDRKQRRHHLAPGRVHSGGE
jgi:hypothetical protein